MSKFIFTLIIVAELQAQAKNLNNFFQNNSTNSDPVHLGVLAIDSVTGLKIVKSDPELSKDKSILDATNSPSLQRWSSKDLIYQANVSNTESKIFVNSIYTRRLADNKTKVAAFDSSGNAKAVASCDQDKSQIKCSVINKDLCAFINNTAKWNVANDNKLGKVLGKDLHQIQYNIQRADECKKIISELDQTFSVFFNSADGIKYKDESDKIIKLVGQNQTPVEGKTLPAINKQLEIFDLKNSSLRDDFNRVLQRATNLGEIQAQCNEAYKFDIFGDHKTVSSFIRDTVDTLKKGVETIPTGPDKSGKAR